jgi:signal transduction histidine kinase
LLLQSCPINGEQAEYIQYIQSGNKLIFLSLLPFPHNSIGVQQLQNVLDKSVEHLDTTSNTLQSHPALFDVHKLIEETLSDCRSTNSLENRELLNPVFEVNVPPLLFGDAAKVAQILGYFLENAVKFTDDNAGKIGVYVALHSTQPQHGASGGRRKSVCGEIGVVLNFTVFDNGMGMNADTRALLFRQLVQRDRYLTSLYSPSRGDNWQLIY